MIKTKFNPKAIRCNELFISRPDIPINCQSVWTGSQKYGNTSLTLRREKKINTSHTNGELFSSIVPTTREDSNTDIFSCTTALAIGPKDTISVSHANLPVNAVRVCAFHCKPVIECDYIYISSRSITIVGLYKSSVSAVCVSVYSTANQLAYCGYNIFRRIAIVGSYKSSVFAVCVYKG